MMVPRFKDLDVSNENVLCRKLTTTQAAREDNVTTDGRTGDNTSNKARKRGANIAIKEKR